MEINFSSISHKEGGTLIKKYEGPKTYPSRLHYKVIAIQHYEIHPSKEREGKDCLYAQIYYISELGLLTKALLITESYDIIEDVTSNVAEGTGNIYLTRVCRNKESGKYHLADPRARSDARILREAIKKELGGD